MRRARTHEAFAHPVQGLEILLRHIFDGHKPHAGTRHRFRDGFGITQVIFVRLHIGFDVLGRHQLHLVPLLT
jgi:hypothetical protein